MHQVTCATLLALLFTLGCGKQEKIESYTIASTSPPKPPLDAELYLSQLDHILVAILPQDDKAWFFKLTGKAPAIDRQRNAFRDFLATVTLATSATDTPTWQLPADWQEKGASALRAATLVVPDAEGELEVAVSSLPLVDQWEDFLVPNVNRWLRQLQRDPLSKAVILKLAQQVETQQGKATLFELSGRIAKQPGRNPHAGLGIAPPQQSAPSERPTRQSITYHTPDGWLPGKQAAMRKAAFLLPGGGQSDEVTAMSFPAAPGSQMADVGANVQRWALQAGITDLTAEKLQQLTEQVTIGGLEGTYVELSSPDSAQPIAIYAAMVKRGEQVWFFKMTGKRELVSGQQAAFREFLDSVQFE